jgi:hypothetical protein
MNNNEGNPQDLYLLFKIPEGKAKKFLQNVQTICAWAVQKFQHPWV